MTLLPEQIALIATITMVAAWLITFLWVGILKKPKPSEPVLKVIVFGGSVVLAYVWTPFTLPDPNVDLWAFVTALMVLSTAIFKLAQFIYDIIWQRLMEALSGVLKLPILSTARWLR